MTRSRRCRICGGDLLFHDGAWVCRAVKACADRRRIPAAVPVPEPSEGEK